MSGSDANARVPWPPIRDALIAAGVPLVAIRYAALLHARWLWRTDGECRESRASLAADFVADVKRIELWERFLRKSGVFASRVVVGRHRALTLTPRRSDPPSPRPPAVATGGTPPRRNGVPPLVGTPQTLETPDTHHFAGVDSAPPATGPQASKPKPSGRRSAIEVEPSAHVEILKRKGQAATPSAHVEVREYWSTAFLAARGVPYEFFGARDGKAIKNVLAKAGGDTQEVKRRIDRAFTRDWWRDNLSELTTFAGRWNTFAPTPAEAAALRAQDVRAAEEREERTRVLRSRLRILEQGGQAAQAILDAERRDGESDDSVLERYRAELAEVLTPVGGTA